MKALLIVTDSEAVPAFERVLAEGFTVLPASVGLGRSGLKAGDRVHPGSSSLIFTVMTEGGAQTLAPAGARTPRATPAAPACGRSRWRTRADVPPGSLPQCGKPTWAGCGAHVEQALRGVPPEKRCQCPRPKSILARLLGR